MNAAAWRVLYGPESDGPELPDLDPRPTADETAERDSAGRMVRRYRPAAPPAARQYGPDEEQRERWAGSWSDD